MLPGNLGVLDEGAQLNQVQAVKKVAFVILPNRYFLFSDSDGIAINDVHLVKAHNERAVYAHELVWGQELFKGSQGFDGLGLMRRPASFTTPRYSFSMASIAAMYFPGPIKSIYNALIRSKPRLFSV